MPHNGLTYKVGDTIYIKYHSSTHWLYLGSSACDFKTEICPNATSDTISATSPCTYKFSTAGSYYISDKAGASVGNGYCKDFGASLPITVSTSS
ncbi:hypothetical protein WJX73_010588 [Symbiochloris irregularis]|uniref:Uncharacterized protein n=1 Tax=Symbiochloris irregularis TaxID=706552 RepID=A0AAW1NYH3_9CHLO